MSRLLSLGVDWTFHKILNSRTVNGIDLVRNIFRPSWQCQRFRLTTGTCHGDQEMHTSQPLQKSIPPNKESSVKKKKRKDVLVENAKKFQLSELAATITKFENQMKDIETPSTNEQTNPSSLSASSKLTILTPTPHTTVEKSTLEWNDNLVSFKEQLSNHIVDEVGSKAGSRSRRTKKSSPTKLTTKENSEPKESLSPTSTNKDDTDTKKKRKTRMKRKSTEGPSVECVSSTADINDSGSTKQLSDIDLAFLVNDDHNITEVGSEDGFTYPHDLSEEEAKSEEQAYKDNIKEDITRLTESDFANVDTRKHAMFMLVQQFETGQKRFLDKMANEQALKRNEERYNRLVMAYIDVCIHTGLLKKAHLLLTSTYFRWKAQKDKTKLRSTPMIDIAVYNHLMHAWARKGEVEMVKRLFQQLSEMKISPSLQSYAAVLECVGRSPDDLTKMTSRLLENMAAKGMDFMRIPAECDLYPDQQEYIVKAIHTIHTDMEIAKKDSTQLYDCPLLDSLNYQSTNTSGNPCHNVLSSDAMQEKFQEQLSMELENEVKVMSIQTPAVVTQKMKNARKLLDEEKKRWRQVLSASFERSKDYLEKQVKGEPGPNVMPYLRLLSTEDYVDLMMKELDNIGTSMDVFSPPLSHIFFKLGLNVFHLYNTRCKQKNNYSQRLSEVYPLYLDQCSQKVLPQNHRKMWTSILKDTKLHHEAVPVLKPWPYELSKMVGRYLFEIILADIKIDVNILSQKETRSDIPALYKVFKQRGAGIPVAEIMPHPVFNRLYQTANIEELTFSPYEMPSLVPHLPWTSHMEGGNFLNTVDLVKNKYLVQEMYDQMDAQPPNQLFPMLDALNVLGSCPWKINTKILDIAIEVFKSGGNAEMDIPPSPDQLPPMPKLKRDMPPEEMSAVWKERRELHKHHNEVNSLWCTELYRLSIANKYRDEVFWCPHHMDFRGRVYAVPPHLNHLGGDLSRSMLLFGQGQPLGPHGLDWLKIHLINLTGFKKRQSNKERLAYANEIMDEIEDSAENPMDGRRWWLTSDSPWQTLACCMELVTACRSPDPEQYICHFPVHQDGSCNGLQHYAALGRDQAGAESVNLYPFEAPKDVYSDVVDLVEKERKKEESTIHIAKVLDGFIRRKVIKQTVMTTVYGVTHYGARSQIRRQLEDIHEFPQEEIAFAMQYVAMKTFLSLEQMFTSTKQIQDWLVLCAELFSRVASAPVSWTTPLGLPVIQPYKSFLARKIDGKKIFMEKPNGMKQKNAFPPNFIHSLDSAHMMLTAIQCLHAGITFVSVHDSYWTHACHIPILNKVCREQFVALHKQPILEDLASHLQHSCQPLVASSDASKRKKKSSDKEHVRQLVHSLLGQVPKRGTFDLDKVLESTYFFS